MNRALDDLIQAFRFRTLPKAEWTHEAHLRVGAWHVYHYGPDEALEQLRRGITGLNERHGTVNSPTSGYHETITRAYVLLLDEFLRVFEVETPLDARVNAIVSSPMASKAMLHRFWSDGLLMSPRARAGWVPPDVAPLSLHRALAPPN